MRHLIDCLLVSHFDFIEIVHSLIHLHVSSHLYLYSLSFTFIDIRIPKMEEENKKFQNEINGKIVLLEDAQKHTEQVLETANENQGTHLAWTKHNGKLIREIMALFGTVVTIFGRVESTVATTVHKLIGRVDDANEKFGKTSGRTQRRNRQALRNHF